jgi:hypothetical protein
MDGCAAAPDEQKAELNDEESFNNRSHSNTYTAFQIVNINCTRGLLLSAGFPERHIPETHGAAAPSKLLCYMLTFAALILLSAEWNTPRTACSFVHSTPASGICSPLLLWYFAALFFSWNSVKRFDRLLYTSARQVVHTERSRGKAGQHRTEAQRTVINCVRKRERACTDTPHTLVHFVCTL